MARIIQAADSHGSLKDLQCLINERPSIITEEIKKISGQAISIDWLSQLTDDAYADSSIYQIIQGEYAE